KEKSVKISCPSNRALKARCARRAVYTSVCRIYPSKDIPHNPILYPRLRPLILIIPRLLAPLPLLLFTFLIQIFLVIIKPIPIIILVRIPRKLLVLVLAIHSPRHIHPLESILRPFDPESHPPPLALTATFL